MGLSIGELFVSLGFDVDDGKLKAFNEGIKTASKSVLELSAIATGGLYALNAFLEGSINRAYGIKNFQTETGQAAEGLQRFQSVVNQVNASISTTEAAAKYRALADAMTDITQQGGGGSLARLTGGAFRIGMKEEDVIEAIRNYKKTFIDQNGGGQIGLAAHARLLEQIGLGAGSERAFDLSREQYNAVSEPFLRSQQTIDELGKLGARLAIINQQWDKFKDDLAADWAGPIISALQKVNSWLRDFKLSVEAIIGVWRTWSPEIRDISVVLLAALAAWALPFGTTLAAVTAIAAAIWDIGRAIRGLPSVTGTFLDTEGKGLKLLFTHPGTFIDNFNKTMDQTFGTKPYNITQNNTYHIQSTESAQDLAGALKQHAQDAYTTPLLSLAGSPSH